MALFVNQPLYCPVCGQKFRGDPSHPYHTKEVRGGIGLAASVVYSR